MIENSGQEFRRGRWTLRFWRDGSNHPGTGWRVRDNGVVVCLAVVESTVGHRFHQSIQPAAELRPRRRDVCGQRARQRSARGSSVFASPGRKPERGGFSTVSSTVQQTGAPIIAGCLSWFDCTLENILPGGDHEILVGRVAAAGGRTGEPLVYWAGDYRALTAETRQLDELVNASDGLVVAYHVLDVDPAEMLDAQNSIEPAIAALAAARTPAEEWDRLEELVDQSELVIDQPDAFNSLALAFHSAIAAASGNRVLQATLASLGQVQSAHYRDRGSPESAQAAIEGHRHLLAVLRCGDPEAAHEEMRRHLAAVRQQLEIG
jgi:hypothetical protein